MGDNTENTEIAPSTKQAVDGRDERGRFATGNTPATGFHTNPERRSDGKWRKQDTPRYKLERMIGLTESELASLIEDSSTLLFERKIAQAIIDGSWATLRDMMNKIYGIPRAGGSINSRPKSSPIVKGFVIPTLPEGFVQRGNKSKQLRS